MSVNEKDHRKLEQDITGITKETVVPKLNGDIQDSKEGDNVKRVEGEVPGNVDNDNETDEKADSYIDSCY